jgi:hypothetical protein
LQQRPDQTSATRNCIYLWYIKVGRSLWPDRLRDTLNPVSLMAVSNLLRRKLYTYALGMALA